MGLETATYISQLVPTNPVGATDAAATLDEHIQLLKTVLQAQFPNLGAAAVTGTAALLNSIGVTQPPGDNSTNVASTAFVQALLASVNAQSGIPVLSIVTGTSQTASVGQHLGLSNGALTTITLPPAPADGDMVWITPLNGLTTNVIARNGLNIMGLAENLTIDDPYATVALRYMNTAQGWRML